MATSDDRTISGRIKVIGPVEIISPTFRKREIVVVTDEQYPQPIKIEFTQDKTSIPGNYLQGDEVKISINFRGREWVNPEGKKLYFNSIHGWRMEKLSNGYIVPTKDGSNHVQHNINFPDAKDVFDQPIKNNSFGSSMPNDDYGSGDMNDYAKRFNSDNDEDFDDLPF